MTPRRIHITGGQGSGKTTLAARLHEITGTPVHGLDLVARIGGGNGPERPVAERDAMVADIAAADDWITEGAHLGWTAPLLDRAEAIVWLDHISPTEASGRVVRRFASGAMRELRTRHGRERFTRVGDYLRHTRDLGRALRQSRTANDPDLYTAALAAWPDTLIHCTTTAAVEAFVRSVTPGARPVVGGSVEEPAR
jgi:adenylate kinase family enzyme